MELINISLEELTDVMVAASKNGGLTAEEIFEVCKDWGLTIEAHEETKYNIFSKIYLAYRRRMKHKGQAMITPQSGQWYTLKRVANEVEVFAEEHSMSFRTAAIKYLTVANSLTKNMKLISIDMKADQIHETYALANLIENDPNKSITKDLVEEYSNQSMARTGNFDEDRILGDDRQFIHFVDAAAICKEHKLSGKEFIQKICDYHDWLGFITPANLDGPKARELAAGMKFQKYGKEKVRKVNLKEITKTNVERHGKSNNQ